MAMSYGRVGAYVISTARINVSCRPLAYDLPHLGRHSRRAIRILAVIALPRCFLTTTAPVIDDVLTSEGPRFRLQAGSGAARIVSVFSRRRRADMDWLPSTRVLHSRGTFPECWAVNKGSL